MLDIQDDVEPGEAVAHQLQRHSMAQLCIFSLLSNVTQKKVCQSAQLGLLLLVHTAPGRGCWASSLQRERRIHDISWHSKDSKVWFGVSRIQQLSSWTLCQDSRLRDYIALVLLPAEHTRLPSLQTLGRASSHVPPWGLCLWLQARTGQEGIWHKWLERLDAKNNRGVSSQNISEDILIILARRHA